MRWTEDKQIELSELWLDGIHATQIAEKFGTNTSALRSAANKLGLPLRHHLVKDYKFSGQMRNCMCCGEPFYSEVNTIACATIAENYLTNCELFSWFNYFSKPRRAFCFSGLTSSKDPGTKPIRTNGGS